MLTRKYLNVYVEEGEKKGEEISISLQIFIELIHSSRKVYEIMD